MPRVPSTSIAVALTVTLALLGCTDERSDTAPEVALESALGGFTLERAVEVGAWPDGRLFVASQTGRVVLVSSDGSSTDELLDIGSLVDAELGEGLLSVALDPSFPENGWLWVYYYAAPEPRTVLARFEVHDDRAELESELVVLEVPQPGGNQNGGAIRFGPDGLLYLGIGDGSASRDPFENGQDLGTLLGAIVRLDVRESSAAEPHRVPADNPFLNVEGARSEIWAYGLRNPWRMAFDRETGELWGGDVMSSADEEVNRFEAGGNYGWNIREGFDCLEGTDCRSEGLTPPVATYDHDEARCAVIGGVVYRGDAIEDLDGWYLFSDFCSGELLAIDADRRAERPTPQVVAGGVGPMVSFGAADAGEVLLVSADGAIWRVVPR